MVGRPPVLKFTAEMNEFLTVIFCGDYQNKKPTQQEIIDLFLEKFPGVKVSFRTLERQFNRINNGCLKNLIFYFRLMI